MVDTTIAQAKQMPVKKRHPKLEDYSHTLRLLVKNKLALVGMVITIIYFIIAMLDVVYPRYLGVSSTNSLLAFGIPVSVTPVGPSFSHGFAGLLGYTEMYSLQFPLLPISLAAIKFDMGYSLFIVMIGAGIGTLVGAIAGFKGGYIDEILMRVTDVFFSVPFLILALAFIFLLGRYIIMAVYALLIIWWPIYARLARGQALYIKSMKFVEAATASGASSARNIFSHVLPNVLSPIFVQISLDLGTIMQLFAVLFFLGVISDPYFPELGNIINQGQNWLGAGLWWPVIIPGIFILLFTISINLLGDGLRDVLDPKLRR
jgi:peptide/nickel transport system permease protein